MALLVIAGSYCYLLSKLAQRSGGIVLQGLKSEADVVFDEWEITNIEEENELDAYGALVYLLAQEWLFQLELMIRVGHGRLSEMLVEGTLDVDRYFRTLDIQHYAKSYVEKNHPQKSQNRSKDTSPEEILSLLQDPPRLKLHFYEFQNVNTGLRIWSAFSLRCHLLSLAVQ